MAITFEKNWAYDLNRSRTPSTPADAMKHTMWTLCAQLTGGIGGLTQGIWTLVGSSDSVTAGHDSTDRWLLASGYDITKLVRASGSSAHSWIVLRSPIINGNPWYMIVSLNSANDQSIRVSFSKTAPTGGLTTATPTSIDQWWPYQSSVTTAADIIYGDGASSNPVRRCSMGLSDEGDFYFIMGRSKWCNPQTTIMFFGLKNYHPNDLAPVFAGIGTSTTARSEWYPGGGSTLILGGNTRSREGVSLSTTKWENYGVYWATGAGGNALHIPGVFTNEWEVHPLWIASGTTNAALSYFRGRVPDVFVSIYTGVPGSTWEPLLDGTPTPCPVNGAVVKACRSNSLWLPANAAFRFY